MTYKEQLKKIGDYEYEIPKSGNMLVPGLIFASDKLMPNVEETSIHQVANVATLTGIQKYSIGMPDIHQGYGAPIGGVAAFDINKKGIISPGMVGYDINCGVRLLRTNLMFDEIKDKKKEFIHSLNRTVPSGVGRGGKFHLSKEEMAEVLDKGVEWAVEKGYATKEDLEYCEEFGRLKQADSSEVSERAIARGKSQLGTLGAGNHFLEVQKVEKIFDPYAAEVLGLKEGQIVIMIHCGSRGLGHQIASDYIRIMGQEFGYEHLADRELINAPFSSDLGQKYYKSMCAGANFAFVSRQMITHLIRENLKHDFPNIKVDLVYDICHNMAKIEKHVIDGKEVELCVHRKGATRSFGPSRAEVLPSAYKKIGQPIFIPGSMGTASYVLVGTDKAEDLSFSSTAHGAGRIMSRTGAMKKYTRAQIQAELEAKGVDIEAGSLKGIVEEAPGAYKNVDEVVRVSHEAGIGKMVARLVPVAVMKG